MPILGSRIVTFKKEFEKVIKSISSILDTQIIKSDQKNASIDDLTYNELDKLSLEELQDLQKHSWNSGLYVMQA